MISNFFEDAECTGSINALGDWSVTSVKQSRG